MKNIRVTNPNLALTMIATLSTGVIHVQMLLGAPLSIWTAFIWMLAVTLLVFPTLFDMEMDFPTTLVRYALFAAVIMTFKVMHAFSIQAESLAAVLLLSWRWIDVALMWLNLKRCQN